MRRRAAAALLSSALMTAILSGCSQISAIAPVGGDRLAEVRYAANDILLEEGVALLTAPVCTTPDEVAVTCTGETADGREIAAESTAADQDVIRVTVGGATVYEGSLRDVLERGSTG